MNIDVEALKAKNNIIEVVGRYVTSLKKSGKDYKCLCPFHAERTPSMVVHEDEQFYRCFGCQAGGDVISFIENIEHTDFQGAIKILSNGHPEAHPNGNGTKPVTPEWLPKDEVIYPNLPVPQDAPPCAFVHAGMSKPAAAWAYRNEKGELLGYDARYNKPDGTKDKVLPWRFIEGEWRMKGFATPTPLYGLEELAANPDVPVMMAEGAKSVDSARVMFYGPKGSKRQIVVVGWQGGCSNVHKVDLTPLHGRIVMLWPDADSEAKKLAGQKAMLYIGNKLMHVCPKVTYFDPNPMGPCGSCTGEDPDCASCHGRGRVYLTDLIPDGWDAADALADGWDAAKWREWAKPRVRPIDFQAKEELINKAEDNKKALKKKVKAKREGPPAQYLPYQALWVDWGLKMQGNSMPHSSLDNVCAILERDRNFQNFVYYDTFLGKTFNCHSNREWADEDEVALMLYIQRNMGIQTVSRKTIAEAIIATAYKDTRNCVKDWLETLVWDGEERLEEFFPEYFGCGRTPYTAAVGRCFLMSLVARAYLPGCKADHMIVLEGAQGIRKSSAMEALCGSPWYADVNESVSSKDFFQGIQGKWLIEIGEMGSFDKSDREAVKQMLSRRTDRYRSSYGHYSSDHARQCVFAGTTNRDNWNRDESGARRFWPIRCRIINIKGIMEIREQLFAEAVARFKRVELTASEGERVAAGADWWVTPGEETKREQEARYDDDPWTAPIYEFVRTKTYCTVAELLTDVLKIETGRQGPGEQRRVGAILRHAGWCKTVERDSDGSSRTNRVWRPRVDEFEL